MSYLHTSISKAFHNNRESQYNYKKRQDKLKKFNSFSIVKQQQLYNKLYGKKRHICFITEYEKLQIINNHL